MKNYILIHFISFLIPVLVMVYLYHFVIRGQSGIAFIYLTIIAVFFLSIISGIIGAKYSQSVWIPAIINCAIVILASLLTLEIHLTTLVPPVFIITTLCSFFTLGIINSTSGTFSQLIYIVSFALILIGGIYVFLAFINGPVHRGDSSIFFNAEETSSNYEPIMPSREQYEKYMQFVSFSGAGGWIENKFSSIYSTTILADQNGHLYSGAFYLYSPQLKINPLPRKKEVILYYIDGLLWGYSYGETHLPTWYTDNALLHLPGMPSSIPFLIYKKYEQQALETLNILGEYYIMPDNRLLVLGEDNRLYIGELGYHYNGLLSYIDWKTMDLSYGLEWNHFISRYFDTLGYGEEYRSNWKANDFIPTNAIPEVVEPGSMKDIDKIKFMEENFVHPDCVWLPENKYIWNYYESLFFNLTGLYGFDLVKKIPVEMLIVDARDKSTHETETEDLNLLIEVINQCIIEPQLNESHKKHISYSSSPLYFVFQENNTENYFMLGYKNGRFIMYNNFYTFILPEDLEREYSEKILRITSKYIKEEKG